jgi:hypothetical protein
MDDPDGPNRQRTAGSRPLQPSLTRRAYFNRIVERLRVELPAELAAFQFHLHSTLLKIYFTNERIHYEVWPNSHQQCIEIGLHFEDGPVSTAAYLAFFDNHIVAIKHELGDTIDLERWTQTWGHLYETTPLRTLTHAEADRAAHRLARMIAVLQPLVEELAIPAERLTVEGTANSGRRRWRR